MLQGHVQERRVTCGKINCRCAAGEKHTAYYHVWHENGERHQRYIRRSEVQYYVEACESNRQQRTAFANGRKFLQEMKEGLPRGKPGRNLKNEVRRTTRTYSLRKPGTSKRESLTRTVAGTAKSLETNLLVGEMARSFRESIEYYKQPWGGSKNQRDAVASVESMNAWRRKNIGNELPEEIGWEMIAAVGDLSMDDALNAWAQVRDSASDELQSGGRAAKVTGSNATPYAVAQFLAIRDSFADQWQPSGGIEWALIDLMTIAFSLQLYWSGIAHSRADHRHNTQSDEIKSFESKGWKSPYQSEADALEQAHKLADGYSKQFMRVLRQLRDLRRYAPIVIQNNGGQVNL